MNIFVRNFLRGFVLGVGVCLAFFLYGYISHRFLSLWIALPLAILPYILLFIPSCYAVLIIQPLGKKMSTRSENTPLLQRALVTTFALGHFSAICAMAFIATLFKIGR